MNLVKKNVTLGSTFDDNLGNKLDSHILTSILTYVYGDKKTLRQISQNLNIHQIKVMLYLDYLVRENLILCVEEKIDEMTERYFCIDSNTSSYNIKTNISDNSSLNIIANDMGEKLTNVVKELQADDINKVSYYIGTLSNEKAKEMKLETQKLLDKIEELELLSADSNDKQEYILITTFAPFKERKTNENNDSSTNMKAH